MKLSDYVAKRLREYCDTIFLVSGGGCIHLLDSFSRFNFKLIPTLHEQGASIAAESFSQYTNNLGVALVTTGPGATNALTGVASAWLDSIPLLLITGQVQTKDMKTNYTVRQLGFQEIDTVSIYNSITKYSVTVTDPKKIKYYFDKCIYLAKNGRPGPVLLDVPLDIQSFEIDEEDLEEFTSEKENFEDYDIDQIIDCLKNAKRPIVLAGNGIRLSNAIEEFYEFVHKSKLPVLLTWKAMDLLEETNNQYVGRPGSVGQRGANFNQQNSDFILVLGARLDYGQIAFQSKFFARNAKKCIVDIDKSEIDKLNLNIEFPIVCDVKIFLSKLNKKITNFDHTDWLEHCKKTYLKYPVVSKKHIENNNDSINIYALIEHLSNLLPSDSLIVPGSSGACSEVTMQAFKVKKGSRIYNSEGLGSMGFGIPAAIGGCLASGNRHTICIDGDGGFVMNVQELELVKRYNLPIKFFILNNDGYGSIKITQNNYFEGRLVASDPNSGLTLPDISKIAYAFDIPYIKLSDNKNLKENLSKILEDESSMIIEVIIDKNQKTEPKASVYKTKDGKFATRPMEDMFPFLNTDELKSEMLIPLIDYDN